MFKRNILLGASAAALSVAVVSLPVFAQGFGWKADKPEGWTPPDPERHEQMVAAIDSGDYQAWLELMGDKPAADKISEEDFPKFAEMIRLKQAGDMEGAKLIAKELDIGHGWQNGKMRHRFGKIRPRMHRRGLEGKGLVDSNGDGYCNRDDRPAEPDSEE